MAGPGTIRRRLGIAGALAALSLVLWAAGWLYLSRWRPSVEQYPIQGIDVTAAAGAIDWPMVRARGADFAYLEATAGATGRATGFADGWSAAHNAGLRRGAVHEFDVCAPAAEQANNFIVTVPRVADALPAAVAIESADCEAAPARSALIAALATYAQMVETHTGEPVILRISPAIEKRYDLSRGLERPLWATRDYFTPGYFSRGWRLWRANDARRVEGVEGTVGWDVVTQ